MIPQKGKDEKMNKLKQLKLFFSHYPYNGGPYSKILYIYFSTYVGIRTSILNNILPAFEV